MATQPWEMDPIVAPASSGFTGVIPGVPKPPAPVDPLDEQKKRLEIQLAQQKVAKGEEGTDADPLKQAITNLGVDELLNNVKKARGLVQNYWSTGIPGKIAELKPGGGTPRDDYLAQLQAIQGGIILEKMQALKDASKTGASGLGALSEKEGERLAAAVAALNGNMSEGAVLDSLGEIENHARTLQAIRDGKDPNDPKVRQQYHIGAAPGASPPSGGGSGPPDDGPKLSPDQQAREKAFLATNPTKEQYASFLAVLQGGGDIDVDAAGKRLEALKAGAAYNPNIDEAAKVRQRIEQEDKLGDTESPLTTLVKQGATLNLSDEAAGVGNAAANVLTSPFTGHFDPIGSYELGRDVERQRIADAREQLGYAAPVVEFAGGMAAAAPTSALAAVEGLPALMRQGAAGGAAGGALAGFGAGEGPSQSLTGAGVGGAGGAAVGALAPYAMNKVVNFRTPRGMAPDLAAASDAEGVDLIRPMVDPNAISDYGALESNVYSQPIIRGGAARVRGQIEDRVADLGRGGTALEPGDAGERLQVAGNRYITRTRGIKDRLYKRAETAAGNTRFVPQRAIDQLNADIQELSANPKGNASTIQFLQDKLSDLSTPGGKTVAEIRNIREGLRGEIGTKNLTMTNAERLANNALQAAGDDIAQAAPDAGRLYKRADAFYRERQVMVDDLKKAIIGNRDDPLDPQKAFANIQTLMGKAGNNRRLSAVMSHLEPDERQDIAATVAESLGRRAPDEPFSTALFLSQTRKLSPSAIRTLFGPGGAESVDNLRLLSQKLEEAGRDINRSRSATVLERQGLRTAARAMISGLAGIGATAATGSVEGGVAGLGVAGAAMGASAFRRVLSARAMVNPRVSKWLAEAADVSTPSQAKQAVKGLSLVISREPALARELTPIRDFLDQRVTQLLAAQPNPDDQNQQQR
jgi:hypothetical protein